jgi:hypothetical protein
MITRVTNENKEDPKRTQINSWIKRKTIRDMEEEFNNDTEIPPKSQMNCENRKPNTLNKNLS